MSQFAKVIELIRKEQVSLFIGAGFSLKAGAPSCGAIISKLLSLAPDDDKSDFQSAQLDLIANTFVDLHGGDRSKLIEALSPMFNSSPKDLSDHRSLASVPHISRIFTTNYNRLIEECYGDKCNVIKKDEDLALDTGNDKVLVFKTHGDFDEPEKMILTRDDYTQFFSHQKNPIMWDIVKTEFATHPILFIGYSLSDDNIIYIIRRVKEQVGSTKPLFLIAPGLTRAKRNKLENLSVTYYDSKADEFFKDLFEELDKTIVRDMKKNRVSLRTFHEYCRLRNLNFEIRSKAHENEIEKINAVEGEAKHKIKFRIPTKIANEFIGDNPLFNDSLIFHGVKIPAYKISSGQFHEYKYDVNGTRLMDLEDLSSFLVAPCHQSLSYQIIIPSENFREKTELVHYSPGKNRAMFVLSVDSYTLSLEIQLKEDGVFNVNIKVDFKEKYSDNTQAIHWLKLLKALWGNVDVKFKSLSDKGMSFSLANPIVNLDETDFDSRHRYYKTIEEIEDCIGNPFSEYEIYTPVNLEKAMAILSYLKGYKYSDEIPENSVISFGMTPSNLENTQNLEVGSKQYCFGLVRGSDQDISLNGYSVKNLFIHEFYRDCKVIKKELLPSGNYALKVKVLSKYSIKWYSQNHGMDIAPGVEGVYFNDPH